MLRGTKQLNLTTLDALASELADCQMYLVLLAASLNINLEEAVIVKFNERSKDLGIDITL